MPRKRNRKYPPKEKPMKGWQVSYPVPGSDDEIEIWFDERAREGFVDWLVQDARHRRELDTRVVWVGF